MNAPLVFDIFKMSAHDGPGMRTVVFLKGCPLRCRWCHNPESLSPRQEVWGFPDKCISCGRCGAACPEEAIRFDSKGIPEILRDRCTGCGACAEACPAGAIKAVGRRYEMDELMQVILREKPFMESTGGGVTLSGGEALLYPAFGAELFQRCRAEGILTAVDTSGSVPWKNLEAVLPYTDLYLYDLKQIDDEKHKDLTGRGNAEILDNLKKLSAALAESDAKLWIRTPLVPGDTDDEDNIKGIAEFIDKELPVPPEKWELCSFNPLGHQKYTRLGQPWNYATDLMCRQEDVDALQNAAASCLTNPGILKSSGLTAR